MDAAASQVQMELYNITSIDIKLQFMQYFYSIISLYCSQAFCWTQYTFTQKAVPVNHLPLSLLLFSPKCLSFLRISC